MKGVHWLKNTYKHINIYKYIYIYAHQQHYSVFRREYPTALTLQEPGSKLLTAELKETLRLLSHLSRVRLCATP